MSLPFYILTLIISALLSMAFFTLLEQKGLGYAQQRKGPNKSAFLGIMQPIADAMKLFMKQIAFPSISNRTLFLITPSLSLFLALLMWGLTPIPFSMITWKLSAISFIAISSISVYTIIMTGWASNSKYALLGALRGLAQSVSYEVSMTLIILSFLALIMALNFSPISMMIPMILLLPISLIWFLTLLAETNRSPFDLSEGESELVSGFNIEYSSGPFAIVFMAEYTSILILSILSSHLLFPMPIPLTGLFLACMFIITRAALPRIRYDFLMYLNWKIILPVSIPILFLVHQLINIYACAGLNG